MPFAWKAWKGTEIRKYDGNNYCVTLESHLFENEKPALIMPRYMAETSSSAHEREFMSPPKTENDREEKIQKRVR